MLRPPHQHHLVLASPLARPHLRPSPTHLQPMRVNQQSHRSRSARRRTILLNRVPQWVAGHLLLVLPPIHLAARHPLPRLPLVRTPILVRRLLPNLDRTTVLPHFSSELEVPPQHLLQDSRQTLHPDLVSLLSLRPTHLDFNRRHRVGDLAAPNSALLLVEEAHLVDLPWEARQ